IFWSEILFADFEQDFAGLFRRQADSVDGLTCGLIFTNRLRVASGSKGCDEAPPVLPKKLR
ncbi:MAG: hypothetical protein COA78_04425, partial [Blastopirellula sp.]